MKDKPVTIKKKADTEARFNRIRWLSVVGGFMDGMKIEFAPGLNCFIGARGTGKTTAVEFVRYAMDTMPADANAGGPGP